MNNIEDNLIGLQSDLTSIELVTKQLNRVKKICPDLAEQINNLINNLKIKKKEYKKELENLNKELISIAEALVEAEEYL